MANGFFFVFIKQKSTSECLHSFFFISNGKDREIFQTNYTVVLILLTIHWLVFVLCNDISGATFDWFTWTTTIYQNKNLFLSPSTLILSSNPKKKTKKQEKIHSFWPFFVVFVWHFVVSGPSKMKTESSVSISFAFKLRMFKSKSKWYAGICSMMKEFFQFGNSKTCPSKCNGKFINIVVISMKIVWQKFFLLVGRNGFLSDLFCLFKSSEVFFFSLRLLTLRKFKTTFRHSHIA